MNVLYPLSHDAAAKVVRAGSVEFTTPRLLPATSENNFGIKAKICGTPDDGVSLKDAHAFYCRLLGPKFNRRFHAAQYHTWIAPHMTPRVANMLRREGRFWRYYDNHLVARAHEVLPYIVEAERDGLPHLIPTIVLFGESPQAIRKRVGRGAWRRFANLSVSRAKLIMHAGFRIQERRGAAAVSRLLDVPSGLLPCFMTGQETEFTAARVAHRKRRSEFFDALMLVRDTRRMLGGQRFNPEWSRRRMLVEHERGAQEANRRYYSDRRFAEAWQFEADGRTATLLTSEIEVANEGAVQHHCVASYAKQASSDQYAIFRIDGTERATLGARRWRDEWRVDQCYAAGNRGVSDETIAFARRALEVWTLHRRQRSSEGVAA